MVSLLRERSYQEIRSAVAKCSLLPPGFLAIDSAMTGFSDVWAEAGRVEHVVPPT
jgi:hypothetical protein